MALFAKIGLKKGHHSSYPGQNPVYVPFVFTKSIFIAHWQFSFFEID
jgi:hypothetical protein